MFFSLHLFNILAEMVMRETLDGFQGGLEIGGQMIANLCYADDIILLATWGAELQELVDRLDRVSRRYSLLINIDKTKVMERRIIIIFLVAEGVGSNRSVCGRVNQNDRG